MYSALTVHFRWTTCHVKGCGNWRLVGTRAFGQAPERRPYARRHPSGEALLSGPDTWMGPRSGGWPCGLLRAGALFEHAGRPPLPRPIAGGSALDRLGAGCVDGRGVSCSRPKRVVRGRGVDRWNVWWARCCVAARCSGSSYVVLIDEDLELYSRC